jgi:hypothetical protein
MTNVERLPVKELPSEKETAQMASIRRPRTWLYIIAMAVTLCAAIAVIAFTVLETIQQADRTVETGAVKNVLISKNSQQFKMILDDLRSGKSADHCIGELNHLKNSNEVQRMRVGLEAYKHLKQEVQEKHKIDYDELRQHEKLTKLLDEARSNYEISPDSLYFAFLARDIMLYMFKNKSTFLIHDGDTFITGVDGRSLKNYYIDAFSVYNLLKRIYRDQIKDQHGFGRDSDNANLFIVAIYCKAKWATAGKNDKAVINEITQALESEEFLIAGQQGQWIKTFKADINKVAGDIFYFKVKDNSPGFISTTWLR